MKVLTTIAQYPEMVTTSLAASLAPLQPGAERDLWLDLVTTYLAHFWNGVSSFSHQQQHRIKYRDIRYKHLPPNPILTSTGDGQSLSAEENGRKSPADNTPVENETVCAGATPPAVEAQDVHQTATPPVSKSLSEDSLSGSVPEDATEGQPTARPHETPGSVPEDPTEGQPTARPHETPGSVPEELTEGQPTARPHETPGSVPEDPTEGQPTARPHETPGNVSEEPTEGQPVARPLETEQQGSQFRDTPPVPAGTLPEQPTADPSHAATPPAGNAPDEPVGEDGSCSSSAEPEGIGAEPEEIRTELGGAGGSDSNLPQDLQSGTPVRSRGARKFAYNTLR